MTALERFEANTRLPYFTLHKYFPNKSQDEDYKQVAMLGLWNACLTYDESKGYKFSTYACTVIWNEVVHSLRKERDKGKDKVTLSSLDALRFNGDKCEDGKDSFIDDTADPEDMYAFFDLKDTLEGFKMDDRTKKILNLSMLGLSQVEISKRLGVSQPTVSRSLNRIQKRLLGCGLVG